LNHGIWSIFDIDDGMIVEKLYKGRNPKKDETRHGAIEYVF
jgi:hypothetical protein